MPPAATTPGAAPAFDGFPLVLTLQVAAVATLIALVVGMALGWLFARCRFPGRRLLEAACLLPLVLPPTVVGYVLLVLVGRRSAFGEWLWSTFGHSVVFHWHGAALASAVVALPLVQMSSAAAFDGVDRELEAASRTLRHSGWATFWRITLPVAWPGILAGTLLAFARAMGEFGASLMVAGSIPGQTQTLAMAIYDASQAGQDALAWTLVALSAGSSMLFLLLSKHWLTPRWKRAA